MTHWYRVRELFFFFNSQAYLRFLVSYTQISETGTLSLTIRLRLESLVSYTQISTRFQRDFKLYTSTLSLTFVFAWNLWCLIPRFQRL
jgi:hypothetical protein